MHFLKAIASMSGDLSKMTAPSFILSPVSLTEYPSYWGEHPASFVDVQNGATPEERMIAVLRWFIGTLKGQYTSRNTSMGSEKKPLNPVLGELFYGNWPAQGELGETTLVSEQVSHHPPITAYFLENAKAGVSVEGQSGQKTSFTGRSIRVVQVGHAFMRLQRPEGVETYLITLPTLSIDGLWFGSPYIELTDSSYIYSSSGLTAKIHYSGRGYFTGKPHSFTATVTPSSSPSSKPIFQASGIWSGKSTVDESTVVPAQGEFWDADAHAREEVHVKPLEQQGEYESRRLWQTVSRGIKSGDYDIASKDKSRIENEQRALRKKREQDGTKHVPKHFALVENDPEFARLVVPSKHVPAEQDSFRFQRT